MKLAVMPFCTVNTHPGWFSRTCCGKPTYIIWPTAVTTPMCKEHFEKLIKDLTYKPVVIDIGEIE